MVQCDHTFRPACHMIIQFMQNWLAQTSQWNVYCLISCIWYHWCWTRSAAVLTEIRNSEMTDTVPAHMYCTVPPLKKLAPKQNTNEQASSGISGETANFIPLASGCGCPSSKSVSTHQPNIRIKEAPLLNHASTQQYVYSPGKQIYQIRLRRMNTSYSAKRCMVSSVLCAVG